MSDVSGKSTMSDVSGKSSVVGLPAAAMTGRKRAATSEARMRGFETLVRRLRDSKRMLKHVSGFLSDVAAAEEHYGRALAKAVAKASMDFSVEYDSLRECVSTLVGLVMETGIRATERSETLAREILTPMRAFKEYFKNEPKEDVRVEAKLHKELSSLRATLPKLREKYHGKSRDDEELQKATVEIMNTAVLSSVEVMKLTEKQVKAVKEAKVAEANYTRAVEATTELVARYNLYAEQSCVRFEALERERAEFLQARLESVTRLLVDPHPGQTTAKQALVTAVDNIQSRTDMQTFVKVYRTSSLREQPPTFVPYVSILRTPSDDTVQTSCVSSQRSSMAAVSDGAGSGTDGGVGETGSVLGGGTDAGGGSDGGRGEASSASPAHLAAGAGAASLLAVPLLLPAGMMASREPAAGQSPGGVSNRQWRMSYSPQLSRDEAKARRRRIGRAGFKSTSDLPVVALGDSIRRSSGTRRINSVYVSAGTGPENVAGALAPFPPPPESLHMLRRSLVNHEARTAHELTLFVDDYVEVLEVDESGWWKGRVCGEEGLFYARATVEVDELVLKHGS
ncbi:uncharacterized protein AMSG_07972 [Thecamonas trahens ATCC 50062]|uniref:SH3 domain-containing protein n=1 Tax=Thecamonas trahens ATCC 50062 TaxID=461836 RepID=A0A0L0DI12_THETB|nr:hypothetical protein AMSG_07972 [Thecamonas trahens ATCC 50062]KNC51875.1 hypothetical protein AMSG_07972 [Thecamonas trahens ATCC 50062]|eukprot:XP_013755734.1 hypothetical protein AMSG_07972 [Thecamonas trahens ATCC 50062]